MSRVRRTHHLGDQVLPEALTDPARQAARDRRWAKLTAHGTLALLGFFCGIIADLFSGTKPAVQVEAQVQQGHDDYALKPAAIGEGTPRFSSTINLS